MGGFILVQMAAEYSMVILPKGNSADSYCNNVPISCE